MMQISPAIICTECTICGAALAPDPRGRRKTTRCRPCNARLMSKSPEKREKCRAAMKAHLADPTYNALHIARITAGIRKAMQDPDKLAIRQREGRRVGLSGLGFNRHGPGTPERLAAGAAKSQTTLAWCPPNYRAEYQRLVRSLLIRAPEARQIMEAQIAADIKRASGTGSALSQEDFMKARAAARYLSDRAERNAA